MVELLRPDELEGLISTASRSKLQEACVEILRHGMRTMTAEELRLAVRSGIRNNVLTEEEVAALLERLPQ